MADLHAIAENLIKGKAPVVKELVQKAVDEGVPAATILNDGLIAGMNVVGTKFKANEFYIPEVLIAARAMHAGMAILKPLLAAGGIKARGKIAIGTVKGDLHDIGKNLVAMMLEGAGYEVIDLGIDVAPEKFVAAVAAGNVQIIGMSALLTTTMPMMKTVIDALVSAGVRSKVKVLIGGAPITRSFADDITADGYAPDAATAVDMVGSLLAS
jgi:5-methyltetrahydrofolate--homocysteine methyltransferase